MKFSAFRLAKILAGKGWVGGGKGYGFCRSNRVVKVFSQFRRTGWQGQTPADLTFWLASGGLVDKGYAKSVTFGLSKAGFAVQPLWVVGRWAGRGRFCGFRSV